MSVDVDLSFPHNFVVELVEDIPGRAAPMLAFPADQATGQDGVMVRVFPACGPSWVGMFAFGHFGKDGVSRVLSMPDPDALCVVAKGAGYVVSASRPAIWEAVRAIPVTDVRAVPSAGLVVFADYTELLAYGAGGVKWRTKRLAWDRLRIITINNETLIGEYWDIREEATQRFEVDLATGAAAGGVEFPD